MTWLFVLWSGLALVVLCSGSVLAQFHYGCCRRRHHVGISCPHWWALVRLRRMASFWYMRLAWQGLFCCLMATFTTGVEPGIVLCQGHHGDWRQSPSPEGEHCLLGLTSCKYKPWWIPSGLQSQARTPRDALYEFARGRRSHKGPFSEAEIADDLMLRREDAKHKASEVPMQHHVELWQTCEVGSQAGSLKAPQPEEKQEEDVEIIGNPWVPESQQRTCQHP
ncbi:uncharacterized protein LOC126646893 [Myiozetetes cayanensis]|uniref:uncharacterized protein LOC126646893 n=1 Tax=Myiozetetes cayanensis TaxID=478635 RepID=UPI00215EA70D|nr:uncharacterized protein LOC126646893 [Myiozetetes cayanensis]